MPNWLVITLSVGVPLLLFLTVIRMLIRQARNRIRRAIQQRYSRAEIQRLDERANFAGQQSHGKGQLRGNGTLLLTHDELAFFMLLPSRELIVPTDAITKVELVRSFAGRALPWRMLCVHWQTDEGEDAAAWAVKDAGTWQTAVLRTAPNATGG